MIKSLAGIFFFLFLYGCLSGHVAVSLVALAMVPFILWGEKQLDKRDREWAALPSNAKPPPDTREILPELGTECSADRL